jgi:hypothetical protein
MSEPGSLVATKLLDKPEFDAVSHLGEPRAWLTTFGSEESVRTTTGGSLARLLNVDHSVLR